MLRDPKPLILLKTRSTPHDVYAELFASTPDPATDEAVFSPIFIPVLEHRPHAENLQQVKELLRDGQLSEKYGGMIFTSQRAVEGWVGVVEEIEKATEALEGREEESTVTKSAAPMLSTFPLYTVGPATSRALHSLLSACPLSLQPLNAQVLGAHAGNGAALATYMLEHYNALYQDMLFERYDAPRLPFVPLVGDHKIPRMERSDEALRKKPLLFLVGETRRDVIPKTLMEAAAGERIEVEEVEVYKTGVVDGFEAEFVRTINELQTEEWEQVSAGHEQTPSTRVIAVVVFSPSGCDGMLRGLDFLDEHGQLTPKAKTRWEEHAASTAPLGSKSTFVVVTIGPTTRDHLRNTFGFEPDVCAKTPSPEGIAASLQAFLREKSLLS